MIKIKNVDLNLKDTITCGQIFRFYEEDDNSFTVILSDRVVNLKMNNNDLIIKSNNEDNLENIIIGYLDLDRNYNILNKELLKKDETLKDIIESCKGFKIMKTPVFETIISFILSQNNSVPIIKKALDNISEKYGDKVIFEDKKYYLFPDQKKLSNVSIDDYRNLKTGFRDKYIYEFVQKVNNNEFDLNKIYSLNTKDALDYLITNKGIGMKVASCILLFAYQRLDVFPIDTWVKKYMKENYNLNNQKEIEKYVDERYKEYSGLFIQYIFHYNRNKK